MDKKIVPIRRRTKRHRHSTITYFDKELLPIKFYALIIRVDSVNKCYGSLKEFIRKNHLHGTTNGKILILSEMISPGSYLINLGRQLLPSLGMDYEIDYFFVVERQECIPPKWLGMRITETGHWVWRKRILATTNTTTYASKIKATR